MAYMWLRESGALITTEEERKQLQSDEAFDNKKFCRQFENKTTLGFNYNTTLLCNIQYPMIYANTIAREGTYFSIY